MFQIILYNLFILIHEIFSGAEFVILLFSDSENFFQHQIFYIIFPTQKIFSNNKLFILLFRLENIFSNTLFFSIYFSTIFFCIIFHNAGLTLCIVWAKCPGAQIWKKQKNRKKFILITEILSWHFQWFPPPNPNYYFCTSLGGFCKHF